MRNFKVTLAYDGTDFAGWQVQPGRATIQGELNKALKKIEGKPVDVYGSGRTDAGVHALGQVTSFALESPIPILSLRRALNFRLPPAIRVTRIEEAARDFHARYSATGKTYEYRIWRGEACPPFESRYVFHCPYPLDEDAMIRAAGRFEGERDFLSLATNDGRAHETTVRMIFESRLERVGERLIYRVRGSGFLYNMVRNIVGTLIEVGRGNQTVEGIEGMLEARDRSAAGPTAPAGGLFLVEVEYPSGAHRGEQAFADLP